MTDEDYKITLEQAKTNKKTVEEKQEEIRKQNVELQKQADDEKKKRLESEEKIRKENEVRAKKEADEKAVADAKIKAEDEAKQKALLAPDKQKLLILADSFDTIILPAVASRDAQIILEKFQTGLSQLTDRIREEAKKL